jgi:predicted acetyltransferase
MGRRPERSVVATGGSFPTDPAADSELLDDVTAITLAADASGQVTGYATWNRGKGYGPEAALEVKDLLALDLDSHRALLVALGSFVSVSPTIRIDTSGGDLARLLLPVSEWTVTSTDPYMLAVLDVSGALTCRTYPPGVFAQLPFRVSGLPLSDQDGTYVLQVADGASVCERDRPSDERTFGARGLALLYAGVQSCANLRFAGLLSGGDPSQDRLWDCLFGGTPVHIRDYF